MIIKVGDVLVNLDLVKAISPVAQLAILKDRKGNEEDHGYLMVEEDSNPEHTETIDSFKHWEWIFQIEYLDGERLNIFGTVQVQMEAARIEVAEMLNNNKPVMPVIHLEKSNATWDYTRSDFGQRLFYYKR